MTQQVEQPRMKTALQVLCLTSDALSKATVAQKAGRLLRNRAQGIEVIGVEFSTAIDLVQFNQCSDMVEERRGFRVADRVRPGSAVDSKEVAPRVLLKLVPKHV